MALKDTELGEILLKQNYVAKEELDAALAQAAERQISLQTVLTEQGLLSQALYENALAEHYQLPFFDIQDEPLASEIVAALPEEIAQKYNAIVVKKDETSVTVATSEPGNPTLEEAIRLNLGQEDAEFPEEPEPEEVKPEENVEQTTAEPAAPGAGPAPVAEEKKPSKTASLLSTNISFGRKKKKEEREKFTGTLNLVFTSQENIEAAMRSYRKPLATRFQSIIDEQGKVAPEILEEILADAIELRASDIHFEPQEEIVVVRFRVDGVLHEAGKLPKEYYEGVVNRVKIEANMRIDEHHTAQDGAIRHEADGEKLDIRISIVPVVDGEKIVMRLLAAYVRTLSLKDLGFSEEHQQILKEASKKPFGMILTTGPTGSGKSTTLSALMKMRNDPDVNISTIEDPVEYKMAGVNHIQVNSETDLTFANGLRALVRQDPDIILVGEIRDGETADISVNAALTGHLLFSTLHSNDAATAVPRLLDMGVEPFLLASTLEVIIGQRLVRRICNQCRYSYTLEIAEAQKLFAGADKFFTGTERVTLYKGKGCDQCGKTGFRGRVGVYELLEVTPDIETLIIKRSTSEEINTQARRNGMKLMFEDGFRKVLSGMTTIEELLRVTAPPEVIFSAAEAAKQTPTPPVPKQQNADATNIQ